MPRSKKEKNPILNDDIKTTEKVASENLVDKSVGKELVKKRLVNLHFKSFEVKTDNESNYINRCFNSQLTNDLKDKILDFFYYNLLNYPPPNNKKETERVRFIIQNNKNKLAIALNIPRTLKNIEQLISYIDGVNHPDERKTLPRYHKLKKLENAYDFVLNYGMNLIHYYYWDDFSKGPGKEGGESGLILKECIDKATPYIIEIKKRLEDDIHKEFEFSKDELREISLGNNL